MLYKRQVIKELSINSCGIFFILLMIIVSIQFVNLLGKVAKGSVNIDLFTTLISVSIISSTPLLLSITCFMSVLAVLTRYWRNSEMIIWMSSGVSVRNWVETILIFAVPFFLITLLLSLFLIPKGNEIGLQYSKFIQEKPTLNFVEQGVFIPIVNGVAFVDSYDAKTGELKAFFSHEVNPKTGKFESTFAKDGKIELADSGIKITLNGANRYLGAPNEADFSVFNIPKVEYNLETNADADKISVFGNKETASTMDLWKSTNPEYKSSLMWRLSIPISILILSLFAISLSYVNPRANRSYNIIFAILLFFFYQNGMIVVRNMIAKNALNFFTGFLSIHLLMLACALLFLYYRSIPRGNFLKSLKKSLLRKA